MLMQSFAKPPSALPTTAGQSDRDARLHPPAAGIGRGNVPSPGTSATPDTACTGKADRAMPRREPQGSAGSRAEP